MVGSPHFSSFDGASFFCESVVTFLAAMFTYAINSSNLKITTLCKRNEHKIMPAPALEI